MAELFDVNRTVIGKQLKNVFESKELDETSFIRNFLINAAYDRL